MTPAVTEEAQRLLRISKADFAACIALIGAPGVRFANAAFHAQQAVEKALKAAKRDNLELQQDMLALRSERERPL